MKTKPNAATLRRDIEHAKKQLAENPNAFPGVIAGWKSEITRKTNRLARMQALPSFEIPGSLRLPANIYGLLKSRQAMRAQFPGMLPAYCLRERDKALANARECDSLASEWRETASTALGDSKGNGPDLCRFPVSGGTCAHWPEDVRGPIRTLSQWSALWRDYARAFHTLAGKRQSTFPASR